MDSKRLMNECPTVVGMLTTVIGSGGSMDTAVREVAGDGPPMSRELFSRVVRLTDTKGTEGIAEGLSDEVGRLPRSASGYRHAMLLCVSASKAEGDSERARMLDEASQVALDAVRSMGESYSSSLTVPCMTVFGLGIMVPMVLMSILPMLGIGGMFGGMAIDGGMIVVLTVAVIPAAILALSLWIRRGNPFLERMGGGAQRWRCLCLLTAVPLALVQLSLGSTPQETVLLSVGPAATLTAILMWPDRREDARRRLCEQGLKDSVFELGNRMMSGDNFETVCSESLAGRKECDGVRESLERELDLCRGDVRSAISAVVSPVSPEAARALCDIHACSEGDPDDAGRLAIALGRQFQNSAAVKRGLELRLKSMTDMMVGTAVLFAPMVLGMSVSMLVPLSDIVGYQGIGDSEAILSAYIVELCALISLITVSLGSGEGVRGWAWRFGVMAPVALVVFTLCCSLRLRRTDLCPSRPFRWHGAEGMVHPGRGCMRAVRPAHGGCAVHGALRDVHRT